MKDTLKHSADHLTGLWTEEVFFARAQERLEELTGAWCMVSIEIRYYRLFVELNGPERGTELLRRFGEILRQEAAASGGAAGYQGQDIFALLVPYAEEELKSLYARLRDVIRELSDTSGFAPVMGVCMVETPGQQAEKLLNHAAIAADEIREDVQQQIRYYDADHHRKRMEEFQLLSNFNDALRNGEITFHLQPQCMVSTGRIVGAESLARWRRPDGSYISPAVFVPLLEKYGLVSSLDQFIWESVCAWLRRMLDAGVEPVPLSVNVSRIDIFTMDVPAYLNSLLKKYDLPIRLLKIEITESAYVEDSDQVLRTVSELHALGFQVLMDDFGSGYSSLNMLRNTNLDVIKLDAQFLQFQPGEEVKSINILESVINMTKSLGTPVIAEGVETQELVQYLSDAGCRYMQGFYFYRPMPADQFEGLIRNPEKVDYKGILAHANQEMHIREFMDEHIYSDAMLNHILGPVAFYRQQGEDLDIVRYNQQFYQMVGIEPEELEVRRFRMQRFFYFEDLPNFYEMLEKAVQDRINGAQGMFRVYRPSGALLWMQIHVYLLTEEEGGVRIFYASARDMTELQYVNFDLPGAYYRCRTNEDFDLLYVSRPFRKLLGYTKEEIEELFDNKLIQMVHPEDAAQLREQSRAIRQGEAQEFSPYRLRHKDGSWRYVADQSRLTDRFGELCWQSILVDITEVMELRSRVRELEEQQKR